ncbi:hypothetical protein L207DRAFT_45342 [Hyaloscypha variabilis F]|uniref:Uncharacterized protein n=1 Tax=Hyaloscypha variabilis (strain UAMH 11265 / GT02V1 / F) TaxID=1149755 RepID=A0A2J6RK31_HYAVF|nr:hypothetical protein L207DRAFT_45342 [Hyaloscypha variabilis F]
MGDGLEKYRRFVGWALARAKPQTPTHPWLAACARPKSRPATIKSVKLIQCASYPVVLSRELDLEKSCILAASSGCGVRHATSRF